MDNGQSSRGLSGPGAVHAAAAEAGAVLVQGGPHDLVGMGLGKTVEHPETETEGMGGIRD